MKTIKVFFLVAALGVATSLSAQEFKVDAKASVVKWDSKKVTGGGHNGVVDIKSGALKMSDNKIESAEIIVDMTTIINTDGKDGKPNDRLVGHLRGDGFFDAEKFPTSKFILTGSQEFVDGEAKVYGRLEVKGITHPINFVAKKEGNKLTTSVKVDRSLYGIDYGLAKKTIEKEFTLDIELILK